MTERKSVGNSLVDPGFRFSSIVVNSIPVAAGSECVPWEYDIILNKNSRDFQGKLLQFDHVLLRAAGGLSKFFNVIINKKIVTIHFLVDFPLFKSLPRKPVDGLPRHPACREGNSSSESNTTGGVFQGVRAQHLSI